MSRHDTTCSLLAVSPEENSYQMGDGNMDFTFGFDTGNHKDCYLVHLTCESLL